MALPDISLSQFNRIATGEYNAGQIDFKVGKDGSAELVKINNHVWKTSKNNVELSPERIVEVKMAFLNALQKGGVSADAMKEIRWRIGITSDMDLPKNAGQDTGDIKARLTPLSRAQVREILDEFANKGLGFTKAARRDVSWEDLQAAKATANMSAKHAARRDAANAATLSAHDARVMTDHAVSDMMDLLSFGSLEKLSLQRDTRCTGANAVNERSAQRTVLANSFQGLASATLQVLSANVRESQEFTMLGETAKLVKGDDGLISVLVGNGALQTRVSFGKDAEKLAVLVMGRTVADMETIGASAAKNILGAFFDRDLESGMVASEKTSLTRQLAALVLANKSGDKVAFDTLFNGEYNTGILVEMAERAIDGENVGDCKKALDDYHAKLASDNANLPEDIKEMLERVANVPLEKTGVGQSEFIVRGQIVGDIDNVVQKMPQPPAEPPPKSLDDIGGLNGVKDFVANLVFSDETMVGDVTINKEGGAIRKMLSDGKNLVAFAEIIKNDSILDLACSSEIAGVVKEGFAKMAAALDEAFKAANNGKSLAEAAKEKDFAAKLSAFVQDAKKLPGAALAKFDGIIQTMANKGCEKIQTFINNDVFKVGSASVNAQGGIVKDPYKDMTADEIKKELKTKTLNQILDSGSNSDAPGQVGFFRQVISNYFTSLNKADKRSCFAAAMKYAQTFDFQGMDGEKLVSAKKAAINKFTGAILKGTSPLLQKMMQGLPRDIMGEYADALNDMKSSLAPIPRKIVQAHFLDMIKKSEGKIKSIELNQSLGAASVGEAFLCTFKFVGDDGNEHDQQFVVKIMRHDAERRVKAEAEIFTAAAQKIGPGMAKTWEGQLAQYMTEFDFTNEAKNVEEGVKLYDVAGKEDHPLRAIAPKVSSMKLSNLVKAQKNVMVAELVNGDTVDKLFKEKIGAIREAASSVFEQDPVTKRILWKDAPADPKTGKPEIDPVTGKPKQVPVFRKDIPATSISNLQMWLAGEGENLQKISQNLLQAAKAWFHEALLGGGKFHGDTHAGNLMVNGSGITFIDFGNLYTLRADREDGVNEKTELLRVITGAAFRDPEFMLGGLEKLMTPDGRAALADETIRTKAKAILDTVLDKSKGTFAFNIVYRLQAAVVELQKLGLELPPQINCFIQSLVRLSNSVTEINTIINQCKAMIDTSKTMTRPAPQRDDLDLVGKVFDVYLSDDGKKLNGKNVPAYMTEISSDAYGGPYNKLTSPMFKADGEYALKVADRLGNAQDPVAEAEKLAATLMAHGDRAHNMQADGILASLDEAIAKFRTGIAAATTPEAKEAAVKAFAASFARSQADMLQAMMVAFQVGDESKLKNPGSFAGALTDVLFDGFDALKGSLSGQDSFKLGKDAGSIAVGELGLNFFSALNPNNVLDAMIKDAEKIGGDKSYQIDIGV